MRPFLSLDIYSIRIIDILDAKTKKNNTFKCHNHIGVDIYFLTKDIRKLIKPNKDNLNIILRDLEHELLFLLHIKKPKNHKI